MVLKDLAFAVYNPLEFEVMAGDKLTPRKSKVAAQNNLITKGKVTKPKAKKETQKKVAQAVQKQTPAKKGAKAPKKGAKSKVSKKEEESGEVTWQVPFSVSSLPVPVKFVDSWISFTKSCRYQYLL